MYTDLTFVAANGNEHKPLAASQKQTAQQEQQYQIISRYQRRQSDILERHVMNNIFRRDESIKWRLKTWQVLILAFLMFFIVLTYLLYRQESSRWANHPYPEAKEYVVKAHVCFGYALALTKLPFFSEKSILMKPLKSLMNHYVEEAKKHIPENDAEREMYWYVFRYYLIKRYAPSVNLDGNNAYSVDEIREILDELWPVIEGIGTKDIKNPIFMELRYGGMENMSSMYLVNEKAYYEKWRIFDVTDSYKNEEKISRYYRLFDYILKMENFYNENYPDIVKKYGKQRVDNDRYYNCTSRILGYEIFTKKYQNNTDFCDPEKNIYLKYYLDSRKYFVDLVNNPKSEKVMVEQAKKYILKKDNDSQINRVCTQLKLKQEDY